jgi:hypothetical protein
MRQATYEIHVQGPLGPDVLARLEGATSQEIGAETVLLTPEIDQESLHQLVARLGALGIELLEVRQAGDSGSSRVSGQS